MTTFNTDLLGFLRTRSTRRNFANALEYWKKEFIDLGIHYPEERFSRVQESSKKQLMQLSTEENQDHISGRARMSSCMSNVHLYLHILNTVVLSQEYKAMQFLILMWIAGFIAGNLD